jgi:transposase
MMSLVGGFDVYRLQITFDYVGTEDGEVFRGNIRPATRWVLRARPAGRCAGVGAAFVVEGCTGWRFVAEELSAAGTDGYLAGPVDTADARGRKRLVKTDRSDARHLRDLLFTDARAKSWVLPRKVVEVRTLGRLNCVLMHQRHGGQQRIHAEMVLQGCPPVRALLSEAGRAWVDTGLEAIDALTAQITPLWARLVRLARAQPSCRGLQHHSGIGSLCAAIIWTELGDSRRFANSDAAVRLAGRESTTYSSNGKRSPRHLARRGSPEVRWALFEAAKAAARQDSPNRAYYGAVAGRLRGKRPALSVTRKLARRCHHTLRELGDSAFQPAGPRAAPPSEVAA